jgi:formylglycine-generating enzyme required for sulfatase activity
MPHDYETPQILHDAPLRHDDPHHFHFDEFAATLCRLIADKQTRTPLVIGVSGSWGSGKTTLLQRVKQMLDKAGDQTDANKVDFVSGEEKPWEKFRPCKTVWFDAWKYQDEDELLVALIRVILATMAQGNLGDKFWGKVLDKTHPRYNVIATLLSFFKFKVGDNFEVSFDIEKYKEETPFAKNTAFFDVFDDALEELIARWVHDTGDFRKIDEQEGALVVFVDDLDRCLPEKTVQVLEAIKLFLDKHGCVFVLGADTRIVQEAVASHYKNTGVTGESAADYLEKIIQLRFDLPPILTQQMGDYLQKDPTAQRVVDDQVRQHWSALVTGADINPRRVKKVVNDVNLQWAMLKNTGQAADVNRDDFTRWQILMLVAPDNFVKRVNDIDDVEIRHKFILDALKWAKGDTSLDATFQDYARSQRLRRVLREIKAFSDQFTPLVADAFLHLTAVPAPPAPPPAPVEVKPEAVPPFAVEEKEETGIAKRTEVRETMRGEAKAPTANVQVWGGVEFIRIPAGKFLMGSKDDNQLAFDSEKPQHSIELPEYWLARYPVTNEQFAKFVEEAAYKFNLEKNWKKKADHPVVKVSWYDAVEYCKWLNTLVAKDTETAKTQVRLPTEAEWEKAARGEYGNEWPWGNEFDQNKCNSREGSKGGTTPVGAYSPHGDSPYGVADMVGNVWEWCHSLFKSYPYKIDDGREDESASESRVLRGGSFHDRQWNARGAYRFNNGPDFRLDYLGFRVVVSPGL